MNTISKAIIFVFVLFLGTFSQTAQAEARPTSDNYLQWIAFLGDVQFADAGAAYIPSVVLQATQQGKVSPALQLALTAHIMSKCTQRVVAQAPSQLDPYAKDKILFDDGICRIQKCFQQIMLLDLLNQAGQSTNSAGAKQQAIALGNSFRNERCSGGGDGVDALLLALLGVQ